MNVVLIYGPMTRLEFETSRRKSEVLMGEGSRKTMQKKGARRREAMARKCCWGIVRTNTWWGGVWLSRFNICVSEYETAVKSSEQILMCYPGNSVLSWSYHKIAQELTSRFELMGTHNLSEMPFSIRVVTIHAWELTIISGVFIDRSTALWWGTLVELIGKMYVITRRWLWGKNFPATARGS